MDPSISRKMFQVPPQDRVRLVHMVRGSNTSIAAPLVASSFTRARWIHLCERIKINAEASATEVMATTYVLNTTD